MTIQDVANVRAALADLPIVRPRVRGWERAYVQRLVAADMTAALLAGLIAYAVRFGSAGTAYESRLYGWLSLLMPVLWVGAKWAARSYEPRFHGVGSEEFRRVLLSAALFTAGLGTVSWALSADIARGYVVIALPLATFLTLLGRVVLRKALHRTRAAGDCMHRVIALGHERAVASLVRQLERQPHHGFRVVGAVLPRPPRSVDLAQLRVPVVGVFSDVSRAVRDTSADTVAVLSCPEMDGSALQRLGWQLQKAGTDLIVAPALMDVAGPRIAIRPVSGLPLLHVEQPEFTGVRRVLKGSFDRIAAGLGLLVLLPLLTLIAVLIRRDSNGPVLFRQQRVGLRGEEFTVLKFRTMVVDAERRRKDLEHLNEASDGLLFKMRNDPRITRVGAVLRRYSLDELPQLINVMRGDMSLVGPRPPLPSEVRQYGADVARRLLVKPGLTGLWQISGRSDLAWEEAVRLDLRYVENWSLAMDLQILWRTAFVVVRGSGAY